jgi:hypothetical protein
MLSGGIRALAVSLGRPGSLGRASSCNASQGNALHQDTQRVALRLCAGLQSTLNPSACCIPSTLLSTPKCPAPAVD